MKKFAAFAGCGLIPVQRADCGTPRAHFPATSYDFDARERQSAVPHVFELFNTGTAPLGIRKIHAG